MGEFPSMECLGHDEWAHDGLAHSAPAAFLYPGCRRAASFPFVGEKDLAMPSVLKVRSQSESEGLNRRRNVMTLEELKIKMSEYPETREEESGCESESVSSTLSQSGSSTDLADLATDEVTLSTLLDEKKRVRFADDCGKELFSIKVMTEPSDVPPLISPAVLRRFRGADWDEDETVQHSSWILSFPQPASEYIRFRNNIDKNKVSLENILLKNDTLHMTGTIKVANIAFEKRVFIRLTTNGWQSYLDRPATFQQSSNKVHDTFTFDIEIPRDSSADSRIEFCVCFVAGGQEHWDSNDGKNYVLLSSIKSTHTNVLSPHTPLFGSFKDKNDAYNQRYDNWSSFASWKNLSVDGPYW